MSQLATLFSMPSFAPHTDKPVQSVIDLSRPTTRDFDAIATWLNIDKSTVLFVSSAAQSGAPAVNFRCIYNEDFNADIKATGKAKFCRTPASWSVGIDDETVGVLGESIDELFNAVIIVDTGAVLLKNDSSKVAPDRWVEPLTEPTAITMTDLQLAYAANRPGENAYKFYVHNGQKFIPFHKDALVNVDRLLIRCGINDGQPRYGIFHTNHKTLYVKSFGKSRDTSALIASYIANVESLANPIITAH